MNATVGVVGVGATGARAARQLAAADDVGRVLLSGTGPRPAAVARSLGDTVSVVQPTADPHRLFDEDPTAIVLAGPSGTHVATARAAIARGVHVVSTSDSLDDVRRLLDLGGDAVANGVSVIAGAAFGPGLSCVLAAHAADWVDQVHELHVARFGTGGPACARQHHTALSSFATDWRDGEMVRRPGGSGRELCAFPDPVGSLDCYRASLAETPLLHQAFPTAERITARQAANRRQRLTSWLPMLRKPHPEGRIGAIRVEVRGSREGTAVTEVVGAIDRPAVAAGAVAGLAARWASAGSFPVGAHGLAAAMATADPRGHSTATVAFLAELSTVGVRAAALAGAAA